MTTFGARVIAWVIALFLWGAAAQAQLLPGGSPNGGLPGGIVQPQGGGTGINNGSNTLTLGGALATSGASTPTLAFPSNGTPTYTFPAATATLPAYVAASWTPAITTTGTVGTPAYTYQVGSYEAVGRQVTVRFNILLSGWTGSPTGNIEISGLPVANANVSNDFGQCVVANYAVAGLTSLNYGITGYIAPNTSIIVLESNANTQSDPITAAQFGTTGIVNGVCSYHT